MDRETAKQTIRARIPCANYLQKSKGGMYVCPYCGSGTGPHGTGALKVYDTNTWTCHVCHKSGDVIDLYMKHTGADYNTALSLLAEEAGAAVDRYIPERKQPEAPKDYTDYFRQCMERMGDQAAANYLETRGISQETARAYGVGYDPAADPAGSGHPCPRLILPASKTFFVARRIDGAETLRCLNSKSSPELFNQKALDGDKPVFVVEGVFDALSIIEAGGAAVALNSAGNGKLLIDAIKRKKPAAPIVLALDNDEVGREATAQLLEELPALGVKTFSLSADICGECKDPNEALVTDRARFVAAVAKVEKTRPDNTADYIRNGLLADIRNFDDSKKTGFPNLDREAGGLYPGLYGLAAVPSLGKTSYALQIADNLAEAGHDVVFFSLEQSRFELVSKSLARYANRNSEEGAAPIITSLDIRRGKLPSAKNETLKAAILEYTKSVGERVSIIEGNFNCNVEYIRAYLDGYTKRTGTRPVVFIDYLQIIQPLPEQRKQGTKEFIDGVISELKRISRDFALTIIVVCSMNRASYTGIVNYEALKETGAIEYTCDIIWGLQLAEVHDVKPKDSTNDTHEALDAAKRKTPREIELVCLKNRYGVANFKCHFLYYPAKDLFTVDQIREAHKQRAKEGNH